MNKIAEHWALADDGRSKGEAGNAEVRTSDQAGRVRRGAENNRATRIPTNAIPAMIR